MTFNIPQNSFDGKVFGALSQPENKLPADYYIPQIKSLKSFWK